MKRYIIGSYVGIFGLGLLVEKSFSITKNDDLYIYLMLAISTIIMISNIKYRR